MSLSNVSGFSWGGIRQKFKRHQDGMLLKRRTGNGKINKRNKKAFGNEEADRISVRLGFFPCFFFSF